MQAKRTARVDALTFSEKTAVIQEWLNFLAEWYERNPPPKDADGNEVKATVPEMVNIMRSAIEIWLAWNKRG